MASKGARSPQAPRRCRSMRGLPCCRLAACPLRRLAEGACRKGKGGFLRLRYAAPSRRREAEDRAVILRGGDPERPSFPFGEFAHQLLRNAQAAAEQPGATVARGS